MFNSETSFASGGRWNGTPRWTIGMVDMYLLQKELLMIVVKFGMKRVGTHYFRNSINF
jgi:hypothetical protein